MVENPLANAGDARDLGFQLWVRKIPWRRKWQPTPIFLPGKFHGQRSLVGYIQAMRLQEWDTTSYARMHTPSSQHRVRRRKQEAETKVSSRHSIQPVPRRVCQSPSQSHTLN